MIAPRLNQKLRVMPKSFTTPRQLQERFPAQEQALARVEKFRQTIRHILLGKDPRFLLVVGPCSIHDIKGAKEYAKRLKKLASEVEDSFFIVMRTYFEKPRTALGWKGLIHDPLLDGSHQIEQGFELSRELLLYLTELELPAGCEFLDPPLAVYNGDLISWGCIGARTTTSQVHRQMASDLPMPMAFKNSIDGNSESAVNGCLAASYPHAFLGLSLDGDLRFHHSKGNSDTHVVLRGGQHKPNYDLDSVRKTFRLLHRHGLPERLLIDCSHDNCKKQHELQRIVFETVIRQTLESEAPIRGLMLESYLKSGSQPLNGHIDSLDFGISVTDPCLSFEETEEILRWGHAEIQSHKKQLLHLEQK